MATTEQSPHSEQSIVEGSDERPAPDRPEATPETTVTTRLELPTRTIVKVVLTLALIWLLGELWTLLLLIFIALLLSAALDPVVAWLEQRRWPRVAAVMTIAVALLGVLSLVLLLLVPPVIDQGVRFAENLPGYVDQAEQLVNANPVLVDRAREFASKGSADPGALFSGFLAFGAGLIQGVANLFILLVLTIYLLIDGERVVTWVSRYLSQKHQNKLRETMPEVSRVVSGYILGQSINSTLFGIFAFIILSLIGVPEPLLLAILAALMDAVPIAGVLIATVPAVLLAATVSLPTAGIVLALYLGYQQIENYVIVPRVFRGTLQISSLAVLIAVLVGGTLLGIVGVILALPVAAAIPVIERIWWRERVSEPA